MDIILAHAILLVLFLFLCYFMGTNTNPKGWDESPLKTLGRGFCWTVGVLIVLGIAAFVIVIMLWCAVTLSLFYL